MTKTTKTTYRIVTLSGRGLPSNVDSTGYDTKLVAEEMAEAEHDGDWAVCLDDPRAVDSARRMYAAASAARASDAKAN